MKAEASRNRSCLQNISFWVISRIIFKIIGLFFYFEFVTIDFFYWRKRRNKIEQKPKTKYCFAFNAPILCYPNLLNLLQKMLKNRPEIAEKQRNPLAAISHALSSSCNLSRLKIKAQKVGKCVQEIVETVVFSEDVPEPLLAGNLRLPGN